MSGAVHDWALVAPWWGWHQPGLPERGRGTVPLLQKYDSPGLVQTFLADPQKRLQFIDEVDRVMRYTGEAKGLGGVKREATGLRKLFLPTHFRHYLVVCSLHCDVPGLPPVDRAQVCQAGFVVRKRSLDVSGPTMKAARLKVAAVNAAKRKIASLDGQIGAARSAPMVAGVRLAALQTARDGAVTVFNDAVKELRQWAQTAGVQRSLKGWVPSPFEGQGDWKAVSELPDELEESFFPLYPLVAPQDQPTHDAAGQSLYFGLVPTGSAEHDTTKERAPRFDDQSVYEIRCFVRRHAPACLEDRAESEKSHAKADCRGGLVWSEPTEPFGLAGHFDLRGTANRPINVRLPDLAALKAQAGQFPTGVQFITPPKSAVGADGPVNAGFQICSFSIPLITIVAMFVFQLFLPIVVLVFQLWFLLALRFCIPPEFSIDAGAEADLNAALSLPEVQLGIEVQVKFDALFNKALGLSDTGGKLVDNAANPAGGKLNAESRPAQQKLLRSLYGKDAVAQPVNDLVWAPRVTWPQVVPA